MLYTGMNITSIPSRLATLSRCRFSGNYFYCVSSMLPHKNLGTLLEVMALRKRKGEERPLVISGVGGDKTAFRA